MKRKNGKQCNGFNLNPHDINRRFDHKIQHKEFNFHGERTNKKNKNKKGMRGQEGEWKKSFIFNKFELMFTFFSIGGEVHK